MCVFIFMRCETSPTYFRDLIFISRKRICKKCLKGKLAKPSLNKCLLKEKALRHAIMGKKDF